MSSDVSEELQAVVRNLESFSDSDASSSGFISRAYRSLGNIFSVRPDLAEIDPNRLIEGKLHWNFRTAGVLALAELYKDGKVMPPAQQLDFIAEQIQPLVERQKASDQVVREHVMGVIRSAILEQKPDAVESVLEAGADSLQ